MPELIHSVATTFAFQGERRAQRHASSASEFPDDFERFTMPGRGIVIAILLSGLLWAGIILGARALWLLFR